MCWISLGLIDRFSLRVGGKKGTTAAELRHTQRKTLLNSSARGSDPGEYNVIPAADKRILSSVYRVYVRTSLASLRFVVKLPEGKNFPLRSCVLFLNCDYHCLCNHRLPFLCLLPPVEYSCSLFGLVFSQREQTWPLVTIRGKRRGGTLSVFCFVFFPSPTGPLLPGYQTASSVERGDLHDFRSGFSHFQPG